MRVVITAAAKADLLAIRRYIEHDNPARAVSFVEELLAYTSSASRAQKNAGNIPIPIPALTAA